MDNHLKFKWPTNISINESDNDDKFRNVEFMKPTNPHDLPNSSEIENIDVIVTGKLTLENIKHLLPGQREYITVTFDKIFV